MPKRYGSNPTLDGPDPDLLATSQPKPAFTRLFRARWPQSPPVPSPAAPAAENRPVQKDAEQRAVFGAPSCQVQHRIVNDPMPDHSGGSFRQDILYCPVG